MNKIFKNTKKTTIALFVVLFAVSPLIFSGCYTDTVNSFSTFTVQIPLYFHSYHYRRGAPDTSYTFGNLYEYDEYEKNKHYIDNGEILEFNYWIDSLHTGEGVGVPFDPTKDTIVFDYIRFSIQYAVPKPEFKDIIESLPPTDPFCLDSSHWMPDPEYINDTSVLGEFVDVDVEKYYRNPQYIQEIEEAVTKKIEKICRERPQFYVITEYSKVRGQDVEVEPKRYFPLVWARYDMVLRLRIKL